MREAFYQLNYTTKAEVTGFEPVVPITRHGILAGFCDKPGSATLPMLIRAPDLECARVV